MPESDDKQPKRGRPRRELVHWGGDEHDLLMEHYRAMHVGFNRGQREVVDRNVEAIIELLNKQRGMK